MELADQDAGKPLFQQVVADFVVRHGLDAPPQVRLLDLTSEVGELAKEVLKGSNYGRASFAPDEDWQLEIGDVLFALAALANSTGVNLETALSLALAKYEDRLSSRGEAGSGK